MAPADTGRRGYRFSGGAAAGHRRAGGYKFMVEDRGGLGPTALGAREDALIRKVQAQPGMRNATTQFRSNTPQLFLDIDRAQVASLGVELNDVNQSLDIYLGSLPEALPATATMPKVRREN